MVLVSDVQPFLKYSSIMSLVGYQVKKGNLVSVCPERVRRLFVLATASAIVVVLPSAEYYSTSSFNCFTFSRRRRAGLNYFRPPAASVPSKAMSAITTDADPTT